MSAKTLHGAYPCVAQLRMVSEFLWNYGSWRMACVLMAVWRSEDQGVARAQERVGLL